MSEIYDPSADWGREPDTTRLFMGIDPDMHTLPAVVLNEHGKLIHVQVFTVEKKVTGREALVQMVKQLHTRYSGPIPNVLTVEAQDIYQFGPGKTKNPKSIMFLATVAGACMERFVHAHDIYFPPPQEWKGNVPKQIHQARICGRMGWEYEKRGTQADGYCVPTGAGMLGYLATIKAGEWKHIIDAIGLALHGKEQYEQQRARQVRLAHDLR